MDFIKGLWNGKRNEETKDNISNDKKDHEIEESKKCISGDNKEEAKKCVESLIGKETYANRDKNMNDLEEFIESFIKQGVIRNEDLKINGIKEIVSEAFDDFKQSVLHMAENMYNQNKMIDILNDKTINLKISILRFKLESIEKSFSDKIKLSENENLEMRNELELTKKNFRAKIETIEKTFNDKIDLLTNSHNNDEIVDVD